MISLYAIADNDSFVSSMHVFEHALEGERNVAANIWGQFVSHLLKLLAKMPYQMPELILAFFREHKPFQILNAELLDIFLLNWLPSSLSLFFFDQRGRAFYDLEHPSHMFFHHREVNLLEHLYYLVHFEEARAVLVEVTKQVL